MVMPLWRFLDMNNEKRYFLTQEKTTITRTIHLNWFSGLISEIAFFKCFLHNV
jgi:hypothetical protein